MHEGMQGGSCGCNCHKAVPLLITLIGVALLLGALGYVSDYAVSVAWPVLLILIGLKKLTGGMCKCCK